LGCCALRKNHWQLLAIYQKVFVFARFLGAL